MFNNYSKSSFIPIFLLVIRCTQRIYITVTTLFATLLLLLCLEIQPSIAADGALATKNQIVNACVPRVAL